MDLGEHRKGRVSLPVQYCVALAQPWRLGPESRGPQCQGGVRGISTRGKNGAIRGQSSSKASSTRAVQKWQIGYHAAHLILVN